VIGALVALYPASWRRRYGEEFRAVLESRPLGPFDVADVLLGALDARLTTFAALRRRSHPGGLTVMLRIGGFGAVAGGLSWFLGIAGASANGAVGDVIAWHVLNVVGTLGLLLALIGLSAFQAHRAPAATWAAFLIPGLGTVASIFGVVGMATQSEDLPFVAGLTPWSIWAIGMLATIVGSVLFAIVTVRADVLSRAAASTLAVAAVVVTVVGLGLGDVVDSAASRLVAAGSLAAFGGSWAWLGISALRSGPIRAASPA
jgi:hypothetical protein